MSQSRTYLTADGIEAPVPAVLETALGDGPACAIVIPCHNYGEYLEEAVTSARRQTLGAVEIIVVDDGSTDPHTREVAVSLIGAEGVRVLFTENQMVSAARNIGIRAARAPYISCLDADDILLPTYLEQAVYILESHANVGTAYCWIQQFGANDRIWQTEDFSIDVAVDRNKTPAGAVFRKADWVLVGGYEERMVLGFEDWEFWLRMGQLGRTGKVMQTPNYLRRRHERSMLDRAERIRPQLIEEMKSYNERLFRDAAWLEAVRASAARDDPFRFPDRLAAMRRALTPDTNQGMLCILPGLASDTAGQASLALMSSLGDRFTFTLLTCEAHQHPDRAAFASHTNDIFHLPASGIAGGFGPFIRYLVATRRIGTVVLSGAHAVADAIPEVRQLCPDVTVVELVPDAEPGEASAMRSTANGTIDHFVCLSAAGRDRLRSSGVGADRIAVPEPGAEAMADAIAQACGRRTADNA